MNRNEFKAIASDKEIQSIVTGVLCFGICAGLSKAAANAAAKRPGTRKGAVLAFYAKAQRYNAAYQLGKTAQKLDIAAKAL